MYKILACHWCLLRCTAWGGRVAVTCWTTSLGTVPHSSLRFSLLSSAKIHFLLQCREGSWRRRSLPWLSHTPVCCQRIARMGRMLLLCQLCAWFRPCWAFSQLREVSAVTLPWKSVHYLLLDVGIRSCILVLSWKTSTFSIPTSEFTVRALKTLTIL